MLINANLLALASDTLCGSMPLLTTIIIGASLLLFWRLYRFSIIPLLNSNEPREMPYWIPFVGHAVSLALDFHGSLDRIIEQFGPSNKGPFTITVAGETVHIITNPKDIAFIHRNEEAFSSESTTTFLHYGVGVSLQSIDKLLRVKTFSSYNINPWAHALHPLGIVIASHRYHLSPGDIFNDFLENVAIPCIDRALDLGRPWPPHPAVLKRLSSCTIAVSLSGLCREALVRGIVEAYYGPVLWKIKPDFVDWFMVWEEANWKFTFRLPSFLSKDMHRAKHELLDCFRKYFAMTRQERHYSNSWVESVEDVLQEALVPDEEIAAVFMLQTWAILGNMYKSAFWLIANLVNDVTLLETIHSEISPAIRKDNRVDHQYLTKRCPLLDAMFSEVLRTHTSTPLLRDVVKDTIVGCKNLRKGSKVMVSYRHLHLNGDVWGPNAEVFQAGHFTSTDNRNLMSSLNYRPFGGGSTLCPGRFLAKAAVFTTVALLLSRYNIINPENKQAVPRANWSKPPLGVVSPAEDMRLVLTLRRGKDYITS